jgi:hypothetical protein
MTIEIEREPADSIIDTLTTKADKIRALARAGYSRTEIQKILGVRYQHVRNVLVRSGIEGGLQERIQMTRPSIGVAAMAGQEPTLSEVLLNGGFTHVGEWKLDGSGQIILDAKAPTDPGVYAFVRDNVVVYVGLTLNGISARMGHYRRGHARQKTSARVNKLIGEALNRGHRVLVLIARPPNSQWGGFPVNTAAGLEVSLIAKIRPEWNIQGTT